jgi:hypothetical protein
MNIDGGEWQDGISTGGQSFMESMGEMVRRVERLERVVTLLAAPVFPYVGLLESKAFVAYLEARSSNDFTDTEKPWKRPYNGMDDFTHKQTGTSISLPTWDGGDAKQQLLGHLLTIAAFEGRMPVRVLADIQPDAMSAVDALASTVQAIEE